MALDYSNFIGGLLSTARITGGLTRRELASRTGVSAKDIFWYESGRKVPDQATVRELAAALKVGVYAFYDPLVIVSQDAIEVLRHPGESQEDWQERTRAASPPLSDEARAAIRAAGDEYWEDVRREQALREITTGRRKRERRRRKRERRKHERRRMTLQVAVERREGERRIEDRRAS